eukprot:3279469-Prymnesium_polylepis.1
MRPMNGTRERSDKTRTGERWWDRAAARSGWTADLACKLQRAPRLRMTHVQLHAQSLGYVDHTSSHASPRTP